MCTYALAEVFVVVPLWQRECLGMYEMSAGHHVCKKMLLADAVLVVLAASEGVHRPSAGRLRWSLQEIEDSYHEPIAGHADGNVGVIPYVTGSLSVQTSEALISVSRLDCMPSTSRL